MRRAWRSSLFGQMALLITLALVVAHLLGYFLLLDQQQRTELTATTGPMITDFAAVADQVARADADAEAHAIIMRNSGFGRRYTLGPRSGVRDRDLHLSQSLQAQLRRAMEGADTSVRAIEAGMGSGRPVPRRSAPFDPEGPAPPPALGAACEAPCTMVSAGGNEPPTFVGVIAPPTGAGAGAGGGQPVLVRGPPPTGALFASAPFPGESLRWMVLSAQLDNGKWLSVERVWRAPPRDFLPRMLGAEALLFAAILSAALLAATRITRPLDILAASAEKVGAPGAPPMLPSKGPSEIRALVEAFNTMSKRVAASLQEKDELIGAIGHDLRTPLASLRIRAESIPDREDRAKIVATIDHMRHLLEDSLDMARLGQSMEAPRLVDASALAESLVEEYREQGADVRFFASARAPIMCRPVLLRRQLRNLIDNALKFGLEAEVSVESKQDAIAIVVCDNGPGVADDDIARLLAPFVRGEASRNRETGGAGLGLAIAARISTLEGSVLTIVNAERGGLRACVRYPKHP